MRVGEYPWEVPSTLDFPPERRNSMYASTEVSNIVKDQILGGDDEANILKRWVAIMNQTQGYGGVFNYKSQNDKEIVELSTCAEWCAAVREEFNIDVSDPISNPHDPPDCFVHLEGRRLGIELVQLIDENHKKRAAKGETPYAGKLFMDMQWSQNRLTSKIDKIIESKNKKYQKSAIVIDALVIHTAEPWLSNIDLNHWLEGNEVIERTNIKSAFLLTDYTPGRNKDTWPVFRIYGDLV